MKEKSLLYQIEKGSSRYQYQIETRVFGSTATVDYYKETCKGRLNILCFIDDDLE